MGPSSDEIEALQSERQYRVTWEEDMEGQHLHNNAKNEKAPVLLLTK